jgi:hypothetical protein
MNYFILYFLLLCKQIKEKERNLILILIDFIAIFSEILVSIIKLTPKKQKKSKIRIHTIIKNSINVS